MANRFWMSFKQAILNTSGFFSITSLKHRAEVRWHQLLRTVGSQAARSQRSDVKGKRGFVHEKLPRQLQGRQKQLKAVPSLSISLGQGVPSPGT